MDIKKIIETIPLFVSQEEIESLHIRYRLPEDKPFNSENSHRLHTGHATALIKRMCKYGANEEAFRIAFKYFVVAVDSVKYKLNIERFIFENNILELRKKYMDLEKEFK